MQNNQIRDDRHLVVTSVTKLEPLALRKQWMHDLAQAVAFLESLNLAHGDLRPENILLDGNRLKLSDFDCTAEIGAEFEACMAPYGRILNSSEAEYGDCGASGCVGPRTEQSALGSIYYLFDQLRFRGLWGSDADRRRSRAWTHDSPSGWRFVH